ncbi:MAG: alpha/beta fold hydrolase [Gammaproteobacteria bacterium]
MYTGLSDHPNAATSMQRLILSLWLLLLLPAASQADVAILVHGHLSSGETWARHGVLRTLAGYGWGYGGHLVANRDIPSNAPRYDRTVYTANLLSTAPLAHQAAMLQQQLEAVQRRHPGESIALVGHSAGGLASRLVLLMYGSQQVTKLITIASPNVGTPRARQGLEITEDDGLLESVKRIVGGNDYRGAKQSRMLYHELLPWNRSSVLEWMNNQPHPEIDYISVIRVPLPGIEGDKLVPSGSQDLNVVPMLAGHASSYTTPGDHFLKPADGPVIARLLAK